MMDMLLIANRYKLMAPLGQGSSGAVYRAQDRLTGDTVALKRLLLESEVWEMADGEDSGALRLVLAHEFKTLAALRHPHIIGVLSYGFDFDRQPYFTMQFLDGAHTLLQAGWELPLTRRITLILQVLQALAYVHRRRLLHRDLKPGNVLVDGAGQVKVLDFGLAAQQVSTHRNLKQNVMGTLAYMPPEVMTGENPSPAADLYAVGMMLYELLAQRHPFDLTDVRRLIFQTLNEEPDLNTLDIGPGLRFVLNKLLFKDPRRRYQSAEAAIEDLCTALAIPIPEESATVRDCYLQSAAFVGREAELGYLLEALESAKAGRGSAWLVGGESGVGKSRLLEEVRIHALINGALVLRGQAVEEGGVPYQLWREPLRQLVLADALNDLEASILKELIPDMDDLIGREVPAAPALEGKAGQQRLVSTITDLIRRQERLLVLILEDIHLTSQSLLALEALLAMVPPRPLLIVASYRQDERADLPTLLPAMHLMTLRRLPESAIAELCLSVLGEAGKQPNLLQLLQRESEGNAFFIVEVLRTLAVEAGRLDEVGQMALPQSVLSGGIQQVTQRRLARVSDEAQRLLKLAALAGRQLDLAVLEQLSPTLDIGEWLTGCVNAAILEMKDEHWYFTHDKLRGALLSQIDPAQAPSFHEQIALAIESVHPDRQMHAAFLLRHWQAAGNIEKEVFYAQLLGMERLKFSAFEEAIRLFEHALAKLSAHDPQRIGLLCRIGEARWYMGDFNRAAVSLQQSLEQSRAGGLNAAQAHALFWLSQVDAQQGNYERAQTSLGEALATAAADDHGLLARIYYGLADIAWRQEQFADATDYIAQCLELARLSGDQNLMLYARNRLGSIAFFENDLHTAEKHHLENRALALKIGNRDRAAAAAGNLGEIARLRGDLKQARLYYQECLAIAREIGQRQMELILTGNLGLLALTENQLGEARACFTRVLQIALQQQTVAQMLVAVTGFAAIKIREGDFAPAAAWLSMALDHAAADVNVRNEIKPFLDELEAKMPAADLMAALQHGRQLDLEMVISSLKAELPASASIIG